MLTVHGSKIRNLTDKIVKVTSQPSGKSWIAQKGDFIEIDLTDFPQSDNNESVATHRIDFTIQGEGQYGVCSLWTTWNQLYYSITEGDYVASPEFRIKGANNGYATALVPDSTVGLANAVVNFQITILNKAQIAVQANVESFAPTNP